GWNPLPADADVEFRREDVTDIKMLRNTGNIFIDSDWCPISEAWMQLPLVNVLESSGLSKKATIKFVVTFAKPDYYCIVKQFGGDRYHANSLHKRKKVGDLLDADHYKSNWNLDKRQMVLRDEKGKVLSKDLVIEDVLVDGALVIIERLPSIPPA